MGLSLTGIAHLINNAGSLTEARDNIGEFVRSALVSAAHSNSRDKATSIALLCAFRLGNVRRQ